MSHSDEQLRGHQRCGHRRVHIPVDEHDIGPQLHEQRLEPNHHLSGLNTVRSRPDAQARVGWRQFQLLKENVGHQLVVVLARMNQRLPCLADQRAVHGRDLHEVRPRADDMDDVHHPWMAMVAPDCALSRARNVIRVVATISLRRIGDGSPRAMACTNATHSARCPLSWVNR